MGDETTVPRNLLGPEVLENCSDWLIGYVALSHLADVPLVC